MPGVYFVDVSWDRSRLLPAVQPSEVTIRCLVQEATNRYNRDFDEVTSSLWSEIAYTVHSLNDFETFWHARVLHQSQKVIGYDGKEYLVWWNDHTRYNIPYQTWETSLEILLHSALME